MPRAPSDVFPTEIDLPDEIDLAWDLDPTANFASMVYLGEVMAAWQEQASILEDGADYVLAQELQKTSALPGPAEMKIRLAKGSSAVLEHVRRAATARRRASLAKVKYDAYRASIDAMRTLAASQREELKRMPGMT